MLKNKKRFGGVVQSNPPEGEMEMSLTTNRDMNALPAEIVLKILSNLSHGNQLWARLVCRKWNEIISIDPTFRDKSVLRVCSDTNNRDSVLKNSVVKWRHLYLKDLRSTAEALPIIIPLYLRKEIETLKISHAEVTWTGFQQVLIQFPSLRELKISRSEITSASMTHWKLTHSKLQSEFENILRGLSSLAASHLVGETTNFFVSRFVANLPVLANFELKYDGHWVPDMLFELIASVSPTLKNLWITFGCRYLDLTMKSIIEVIQNLNESEIVKTYLNLDTFSLRYGGSYRDYNAKDIRTLLDFIKTNKNLKRICGLPENNSSLTTDLAREFIRKLPRDLVGIDVPATVYLWADGNFFDMFEKLESIRVCGNIIRPSHLNPNLYGQALPTVHVFENCIIRDTLDMELIVRDFPNLVKLQATINFPRHSKTILRQICGEMKLLVCLDLTFGANSEVTDSGVTGISIAHCVFLRHLSFESLMSMKDDPISGEHMTGFPLCSLRRLEKLIIVAHTMSISNVGLCFGFRFPGLKKLALGKTRIGGTRNIQITPEGLRFIADYNRSLEEVSLHNIVRVNSDDVVGSEAVKNFQNRMDRCKSFRMKMDNSAHDASDASGSSDSDD